MSNPYDPPQQSGQPRYDQQPPAYGQPPPYGQNPYGYGQPQGGYLAPSYAGWWTRVAASLLDSLVVLPFGIAARVIEYTATSDDTVSGFPDLGTMTATSAFLYVLFNIASFVVSGWNRWYRAGRTGQSLGKTWMNVHLVYEATGQPIGPGRAFLRDLVHILDYLCLIGFIVAAFDSKRQTFADKIMKTIVVNG